MPHRGEFPLPEAERSGNEDLRRLLLEVPKAQQLSVFRLPICRTHFGVSEFGRWPLCFSFPDCQSHPWHGESSVLSKSKWCLNVGFCLVLGSGGKISISFWVPKVQGRLEGDGDVSKEVQSDKG